MLIKQSIIQNLCKEAGESRTEKAKKYAIKKKVKIKNFRYEDSMNFSITANVIGQEEYKAYIQIKEGQVEDVTCTCPDYETHYGICKHTLATIITASEFMEEKENSKLEEKEKFKIDKYRNFKQILTTFYNEQLSEIDKEDIENKDIGSIKIEPKIIFDKLSSGMKVEFKIGNERMYKIKDLSEFYTRMQNGEYAEYGQKLGFLHIEESFEKESKPLLNFILKHAEIIKETNSTLNSNYRYFGKALSETSILLGPQAIDEFFEIEKNKVIPFQNMYIETIEMIENNPKINFVLSSKNQEYTIKPNIDIFGITIIKGKNYKYILLQNKLYRCNVEFEKTVLKLLKLFRQNYIYELALGQNELKQFFSIMMPELEKAIIIKNIDEKEIQKLIPQKLSVKIFLDFDKKNYMTADVKFCYDEEEFNPLDENIKINTQRNQIEEAKVIKIFQKSGFMLDTKNLRLVLPEDDMIYDFLTNDINLYMQKFEVLITENFKTKQINHNAKISSIGVKVENNLLSIDLTNLDIDTKELENIMQRYSLKKKYYRLKNGSFLNLEGNDQIEFLDKLSSGMDISWKEIEKGEIQLPIYRTMYLNTLLKQNKETKVIKNEEYKKIVNTLDKDKLDEDIEIPKQMQSVLRYYQKSGFKWLKVLDSFRFGGILADDMGLGKTLQILTLLEDSIEHEEEKKRKASIVVAPSSLALNWESEAKKFTPNMKVLVIKGTAEERKNRIQNIDKYDLIITSYDLLKRDIENYIDKNYTFRYIIADEAQYLKNSNTQNAKTIKKMKAETRYALTGTPIENSLAELWSIFDYIMPGYLFSYQKFKKNYETPIVKQNDETSMKKLKMLIEPFILRRTKKEVLTELPEKTVTVLDNEMKDEQKNIYLSYLFQAKKEVADQIEERGYEKSTMKILAALTRLRQICCHPSLFLENYNEGSSKLEQCIEIVEEGISAGHKILIFSSYTSMFKIIQKRLNELNIKYFLLTGSTKVDERIKLVEEFNKNEEIKVFLISLKAGGTGLNLTGADMVIHYDPWWNISTENQATDRAYRIGQKNNVQVYKLITKNSIEEKIYELQQKKSELIDNMLDTKPSFINQFSKEEILALFE